MTTPRHALDAPTEAIELYHPNIRHLLDLFAYDHLPPHLAEVSRPLSEVAHAMANTLGFSAELEAGIRKLLEAKDCFVRQAVIDAKA